MGSSTTFMNRPLADVVNESPYIVRGTTGASYSNWDKSHQRLYTYTELVVVEVLKGNLSDSKILLRQPGGSKDGIEMMVPGSAHFAPDEDVVVMLSARDSEDGSFDVPGLTTGKYNVKTDNKTGEVSLISSMGGAELYDPGRDSHSLSYNSQIPLDAFRKIAHGEDVPELHRKQFDAQGPVKAPSHAPAAPVEPPHVLPAQPQSPTTANTAEVSHESSSWLPIGLVVVALLGGLGIWKLTRGGKGGGA